MNVESPKDVRSPGWDPGCHEEVRNGPENKIHIWEVKMRVTGKVRDFPVLYRESWKATRYDRLWSRYDRRATERPFFGHRQPGSTGLAAGMTGPLQRNLFSTSAARYDRLVSRYNRPSAEKRLGFPSTRYDRAASRYDRVAADAQILSWGGERIPPLAAYIKGGGVLVRKS